MIDAYHQELTPSAASLHAPKEVHVTQPASVAPQGPDPNILSLQSFLDSVQSINNQLVLSPDPERKLYHYTDLGGLQGIVENNDLWLTHLRYANDAEELSFGYRVAREVMKEQRENATSPLAPEFFQEIDRFLDPQSASEVYICCFCKRDNLLSQWRGYGANGSGVSIEFTPASFAEVAGADCPIGLMRFWKVYYKPETQRSIIESAIAHHLTQCQPASVVETARKAADAIQFFIPTFKSKDFEVEEEWRLIFTPRQDCPVKPRFRTRNNMLVPFYSLRDITGKRMAQLPITQVMVGPSTHRELNRVSTEMLLSRDGYRVPTKVSETSFRGS
jgi:hypothetical protein